MRLMAVAQLWTTPESCHPRLDHTQKYGAASPGLSATKATKNTRMSKVKKVADRPQGGTGAQSVLLQYSAAPALRRYGI